MSSRRYRFGPLEQRAVVGPLRIGQVLVVASGALLGLAALYVMRNALGLIVGLLALGGALAAISVPLEGRSAEEWAPIVGRWTRRRRDAQRGYRSAAPHGGTRIGEEGEASHETSLPPELAGLKLLVAPYGSAEVGVIEDRVAGTFTATLAVRAGAFAMRDSSEQERALDAWGSVLARFAACSGSSRPCPAKATSWPPTSRPSGTDRFRWNPTLSAPTSSWSSRRHRPRPSTRS
jgi:hypothetical protein